MAAVIVERDSKFLYTDPVTLGRVGEIKVRALIPSGSHLVALYHAHLGDGCGKLFSREDVDTAIQMKVPSYIGVPADGSVRLFVPGKTSATPNICHGASAGEIVL